MTLTCRWDFPPPDSANSEGLVSAGADLAPASLLMAYSSGMFPMPLKPGGVIGWWSPDPRGVLEPGDLILHRSLRRSCRRYEVRVSTAFEAVIRRCGDPARPNGWIDGQMHSAYLRLHELGFAHSVESWQDGELVGGLYGVALGGLFAGESMFHTARDASKTALVALVEGLLDGHRRLIDVQWPTRHLRSLGARGISRSDYLQRLPGLLETPLPRLFASRLSTARPRPSKLTQKWSYGDHNYVNFVQTRALTVEGGALVPWHGHGA